MRSFDASKSPLEEDLFEEWQDAAEEASLNEPTDADLKVRSFYVVEMGYRTFLPSAISRSSSHRDIEKEIAKLWSARSYESLTDLIQRCESWEKRLVVDKGVSQLLGVVQGFNDNAGRQHPARMNPQMMHALDVCIAEVRICKEMAKHLRGTLSSTSASYSKMGGLLFSALEALGKANMAYVVNLCRRLVQVTVANPVSPARELL